MFFFALCYRLVILSCYPVCYLHAVIGSSQIICTCVVKCVRVVFLILVHVNAFHIHEMYVGVASELLTWKC